MLISLIPKWSSQTVSHNLSNVINLSSIKIYSFIFLSRFHFISFYCLGYFENSCYLLKLALSTMNLIYVSAILRALSYREAAEE